MIDASAPILSVNKAYLIGESERGILYTNDVVLKPVIGFMNIGDLTESVSIRGNLHDELGPFLYRVHTGQEHVGEVFMFNGRTRIDLNHGLAALYETDTCVAHITGAFMVCAQGFMMVTLNGTTDTFGVPMRRTLPVLNHYQLAWVDRNGDHHTFRDIIEVQ